MSQTSSFYTADQLNDSYDVVVMGSGASGLTAAVRAAHSGLRVAVVEKAEKLGGTSAAGGGVIWAPANHLGATAGYQDSEQDGIDYLTAAAGDIMSDKDIAWYVRTSGAAVKFLDEHTRVELLPLSRPDYHMEWPGAAAGGRSLDNAAFRADDYPDIATVMRQPTYFPLLTMVERDDLDGLAPDPQLLADRAAQGVRTMGGALVGSLTASALDVGVHIALSAPVTNLSRGAEGWQVTVAETKAISAAAVVIASGGFEYNERLRKTFLPLEIIPIGAPSNEGEGLELGMAVGASLLDMNALWGVPIINAAGQTYDGKPTGRMGNVEMTLPGSITVNTAGRRFVNEALNYHDAARVFANIDPHTGKAQNNPAWLVFDHTFMSKYPVAGSTPGQAPEWMLQAESLDALAELAGIEAEQLVATVEKFNDDARQGIDSEFGRGSSEQDRHLGDSSVKPNPCLSPLETGPYYAVPLHAGTLGTSGGLATNHDGQVLNRHQQPIEGLYAAGNVSGGVFRNTYPGGGATLGSGITRAYAVGRNLAQVMAPVPAP
ncbi:FAD-dependent oxidoreductase [Enteractinococcus coprophilus]|uniref:3-oxosteroid 1-dehydrogenase n=1 Tax=Enteractinococcus coprophilus TaxID=1027633 RepID=A0A543ANX6_9MICC|nr:FAD-dependent oxidoreductase [Enteractinococcus coprophilus]TQL74274.1 3-oxosteroid 1-dehydrogenase [Enteractinococcus coprophilus]